MRCQRAELPLQIGGVETARLFFAGRFARLNPNRETLWVAHLDNDARCLHVSRHRGDESGIEFPFRTIITDAVAYGSAGIILAHNHPSGDATPSDADCWVTRKLACAADVLGCKIVDHLVYAGDRTSSLRLLGLL